MGLNQQPGPVAVNMGTAQTYCSPKPIAVAASKAAFKLPSLEILSAFSPSIRGLRSRIIGRRDQK